MTYLLLGVIIALQFWIVHRQGHSHRAIVRSLASIHKFWLKKLGV